MLSQFRIQFPTMLTIATLSCLIVGIFAATTVAPHEHHESAEMENFSFGYEHSTQAMVVRSEASCFIFELTADEQSSIHTDSGMNAVEMRVIKEIDSAYYTVVPQALIHPNLVKSCKISHHNGQTIRYAIVH